MSAVYPIAGLPLTADINPDIECDEFIWTDVSSPTAPDIICDEDKLKNVFNASLNKAIQGRIKDNIDSILKRLNTFSSEKNERNTRSSISESKSVFFDFDKVTIDYIENISQSLTKFTWVDLIDKYSDEIKSLADVDFWYTGKSFLKSVDDELNSYLQLEEGWDGYDGKTIDPNSVNLAKKFARLTRDKLHSIEFYPEPTGNVSLEYSKSKDKRLFISFQPDGELIYVAIIGNEVNRGRKVSFKSEQSIPQTIRNWMNAI